MVYQLRVTLKGIKGFFRVYYVNSENTLYSFHKQMRSDMEFPQDQLILFKAYDKAGNVAARYGLFDLGDGAVDEMTLAKVVAKGITAFTYFYDTTNKKSVEIAIEGPVAGENVTTPTAVEFKGPNPIEFENGYVAFEDLPDDQRHLPGEADKARSKSKMDDLLKALTEDPAEADGEDEDIDDEDIDVEEDEDDEDEDREEEVLVFDGSEELTL